MTAAFAVISLLNWWHDGHSWRWTGGIAVLFLAATALYPAALKPLNQLWHAGGVLAAAALAELFIRVRRRRAG
jgi:hypothetical protein